jgi:hypothetical protein
VTSRRRSRGGAEKKEKYEFNFVLSSSYFKKMRWRNLHPTDCALEVKEQKAREKNYVCV